MYYLLSFWDQRKIITDPKEILMKFLAVVFMYAGISLIYFSITGKPLLTEDVKVYNVYIFIIGFIAIIWTVPFLVKDFYFFKKLFVRDKNGEEIKLKKKS